MELFWKKGFEGAHLRELVETTGLNRFSLYQEFGGKDGLFQECIANYLDQADEAYQRTLRREPRGLDNIRAYFESIRFEGDYEGCFFINTLSEKHLITDTSYKLVKKFAAKVEKMFLENLEAAQEKGEIAPDRDAKALARFLTINDQGLAIYGIVAPRKLDLAPIMEMILGVAERN